MAPGREREGPDLCLVIPAFNEELRLPPTLDRLATFTADFGIQLEVVIVDDGGSDRTGAIVAERMANASPEGLSLRLVRIEHRGKGAAVRAGMARAKAPIVGYCDADLSAGPDAIAQLYRVVKDGVDVAIASRGLEESVLEVRQPWYRERAGRLFNLALRKLAGITLRDTQCGLKLFREPVAARVFRHQRIDGFAFDAEIVVLAVRLGHSVEEVPIRWSHVEGSKVSMVRDSLLMSRDVVRIVRRLHRGEIHPLGIPTDEAIETMATSEEKHWWHVTKRRLVEPWLVPAGPGSGRYLDVGCGGGAMLVQARGHVRSFGVDLSADVLRHTQNRGIDQIARSDAAGLPFAAGSFSTVSALDMVEHYALPGVLLNEVHRVLEPDGRLIVTVPAFQWMWSYADHVLGHYRRYTKPALEHDLREAGFTVERITYFHSWLLPIAWLFRKLRSLLGRVESPDDFPLPGWLNRVLLAIASKELRVLAQRDLPFGLSLLAVARPVARPDSKDSPVALLPPRATPHEATISILRPVPTLEPSHPVEHPRLLVVPEPAAPEEPAPEPEGSVSVAPEPRGRHRRFRVTEARAVFAVAACVYIAVGALLVYRYNAVRGDSLSRVANAYYTVYSRDPHLAAIGFVWGPLPSLLMLPLLPLKALWPSVVTLGFAANIVSSLCTAGAVVELRGILADLGLGRTARLTLITLFTLHPMIVYYGSNGMTEGIFLLFLLMVVRSLGQWARTGEVGRLVAAGTALGLAYLTRYEALAAGAGAVAVVCVLSYVRARPDHWRRRTRVAAADGAILAAPLAACVVVWAACSWILVGHPFEQFGSVYGNASQLANGTLTTAADLGGASPALLFLFRQLLLMEPLFLAAAMMGLAAALRRRNVAILPVAGVLGSVLGFTGLLFVAGKTAPWLRYQIVIVPLAVLLMALAMAPAPGRPAGRPEVIGRRGARLRAALVTATGAAVLGSGLYSTWQGLPNASLASEEHWHLGALVAPGRAGAEEKAMRRQFETEHAVARFLDESRLRRGSVLLDSFLGFPIVLASQRPKQFVITSDRDFLPALSDPATFDVEYFLVPDKLGEIDAIDRTYPGVFQSGAGIGTLVREFGGTGTGYTWRLYRTNVPAP